MTRDGNHWSVASSVSATNEASHGVDEQDDAPVAEPEYGDLLDAQWLEPDTTALDPDDDLVDIGLTIDLDDADGSEELGQGVELDVGTLLTSLPPPELDASDTGERLDQEHHAAGVSTLHELLLPEEELPEEERSPEERSARRREEDEGVGNDDRFPVFEGVTAPLSDVLDDDAEGPSES